MGMACIIHMHALCVSGILHNATNGNQATLHVVYAWMSFPAGRKLLVFRDGFKKRNCITWAGVIGQYNAVTSDSDQLGSEIVPMQATGVQVEVSASLGCKPKM